MSEIARLFVSIGAQTKEFEQGLKGVQGNLQRVGGQVSKFGGTLTKNLTLPILAAGGAAVAWATKMGNTADRILDLSEITGLTTGAIQEWQHVAKMAGVDTEAMTRVTERLNREMTNIQKGTGKASEAIESLGIEAEELAKMNADERLDTLVSKLAAIEDPAERARIGSDLFGRQWEHVAPIVGLGSDELERLRQEGEKYAMSNEDLNKANDFRISMEEMKAELGLAAREMGMELMPVMGQFVDFIKSSVIPLVVSLAQVIGKLFEWFGNLSPQWQKVIGIAVGFVIALGPILLVVGKIISVIAVLIPIVAKVGGVIAAIATGPIALIVLAIIGLIAIWVKWGSQIRAFVSNALSQMRGFVSAIRRILSGVTNAILGPFRRAREGLSNITSGIRNTLSNLNPFKRRSPSLVDQVRMGADAIMDSYRKLEDLNISPMSPDVAVSSSRTLTINGTMRHEGVNNQGQLIGSVNFSMEKLAEMIRNGDNRLSDMVSIIPGLR